MHFHRFIGECSKFLIHLNDKKSISKSISCLSIHSGGPLICLHPSSLPVEFAHNVDLAGEDRVWRNRTRISDSIPSFDISTFPLFLAQTTGELGHRTRMGQINHFGECKCDTGTHLVTRPLTSVSSERNRRKLALVCPSDCSTIFGPIQGPTRQTGRSMNLRWSALESFHLSHRLTGPLNWHSWGSTGGA